MSKRTRESKSWVKAARGTLKLKEWKQTLPSYYKSKVTVSAGKTSYTKIVPYNKGTTKPQIHHDLVAYLSKFFPNLL